MKRILTDCINRWKRPKGALKLQPWQCGEGEAPAGLKGEGLLKVSVGSGLGILHPWTLPGNYLQGHGLPHFYVFILLAVRVSYLNRCWAT